jgi:Predicted hydrolase (metallo-beta-lactamase superfamily)
LDFSCGCCFAPCSGARFSAFFGAFCCRGASYDSGWGAEPEPLKITFLDVGQGLAVLLEHEGRYALYDSGPDSAGLVDTLAGRGVKSLDWVLVSHFHRDHGGGFMEMGAAIESERLKVGRLLVGLDTAVGFVSDSVYTVARRYKIPVDTLERGDTVYFAEGLRLECLWPVSYGRFGENRASVVLMGLYGRSAGGA